ncbi:MAG: hypothetical protein COB85_05925 [Bacteroidetes bacterium]|nr:MAG: hypothetical protein COB85_05925 [Bacteroidota bacterium]
MQKLTSLVILLALSAIAIAQSNIYNRSEVNASLAPFYHGVASGDPLTDRVIIWTRYTPDSAQTIASINWEIASDTTFTNIINSGTVSTDAQVDYTVKVDATGLQANSWYYYRFSYAGQNSLIGRTRTAPSGPVDSLRFAVVSCSDYVDGYFHGYTKIVERNDIDAVIHLGDYIYENGEQGSLGREHEPPNRITELNDYRQRYSQYRLDRELRCVHQMYPFINIWDDHELANNTWFGGADGHDSLTDGVWEDRRTAAARVFYEWLPIRQPDLSDTLKIYRAFKWGDLLDLYMTDTRLIGRDQQDGNAIDDTSRYLLGTTQLAWLSSEMKNSTAQWKIMAQQVMMAPLEIPFIGPFTTDAWDGYRAERSRLYDTVLTNNINKFVVLTGDIHTAWANNLEDGSSNKIGVEFICSSITTMNSPFSVSASTIKAANPHIQYVKLTGHGYYILDINTYRCQADYNYVGDITDSTDLSQTAGPFWYTNDSANVLQESSNASIPRSSIFVTQPPKETSLISNLKRHELGAALIGAYPNPFWSYLYLKLYLFEPAEVNIEIYNMMGVLIRSKSQGELTQGLHYLDVEADNLASGAYLIKITLGDKLFSRKVIRY